MTCDELARTSIYDSCQHPRSIPAQDALLLIPGEDLFYYATGRAPHFRVLMFDHTVNPYSPEEIVQTARDGNVRWLVLKRDLQLEADPVEDKQRLLGLLHTTSPKPRSLIITMSIIGLALPRLRRRTRGITSSTTAW